METGAEDQSIIVEVIAGIVQRRRGLAIAEEDKAARHVIEEAGKILRRRHRLAGNRDIAGFENALGGGEGRLDQFGIVAQRHESLV